MGLIVRSICKLIRIARWSEPRFVFVCQLVEVIREADANKTSGEDGSVLPDSLVDESQLIIPKLRVSVVSLGDPGKEGNFLRRSLPGLCRRW